MVCERQWVFQSPLSRDSTRQDEDFHRRLVLLAGSLFDPHAAPRKEISSRPSLAGKGSSGCQDLYPHLAQSCCWRHLPREPVRGQAHEPPSQKNISHSTSVHDTPLVDTSPKVQYVAIIDILSILINDAQLWSTRRQHSSAELTCASVVTRTAHIPWPTLIVCCSPDAITCTSVCLVRVMDPVNYAC